MSDPERRAQIRAWLLVAVWSLVILLFSMNQFSAGNTRGWLHELALRFFPGLTDGDLGLVHHLVRRGAHVFEYAVLAALALRAFSTSGVDRTLRAAAFALLLCGAVAALDETLQGTRTDRSGSPRDVALDLAGAAGGATLFGLALRRRP